MDIGVTRTIRKNDKYHAEIGRLDQSGYVRRILKTYSSRITTCGENFQVLFEDEDDSYYALRKRLVEKFDSLNI